MQDSGQADESKTERQARTGKRAQIPLKIFYCWLFLLALQAKYPLLDFFYFEKMFFLLPITHVFFITVEITKVVIIL